MLLFVAFLTMLSYWVALLVMRFGTLLMTRFLQPDASITTGCGNNYDRRTYEVSEANIRVRPDNVVDDVAALPYVGNCKLNLFWSRTEIAGVDLSGETHKRIPSSER
jgi:hypothetical protein